MLCLAPQLWDRLSGPRDSSGLLSGGTKPSLNTAVPCYFLGHLLLMITRPWVDGYQLLRTNPTLQVGATQLLLWWSTPPPERLGALQGNKRSGWFSFKGKMTWSLGHLLQPTLLPFHTHLVGLRSCLLEVRALLGNHKCLTAPSAATIHQQVAELVARGCLRNICVFLPYSSHDPHLEIQCKSLISFNSGFHL